MLMNLLWLALGLGLLTIGGDVLVRGALAAAERAKVSPLLAGLVIVGFGTSAPELVVSVNAALNNQPDIAVGNVVGSNIANILLILGLSACIFPMVADIKALKRDGSMMIVATLLFILSASIFGLLNWMTGVIFLGILAAYLVWAYRTEKADDHSPSAELHAAEAAEKQHKPIGLPLVIVFILGGLGMLIIGANRFLLGAVGLGEAFGIPEAIIGLTVVAVGTSLPEFAVSLIAAFRRHGDVAIGNVLGSNIFNILAILGISSLITPLSINERMIMIDQWMMLVAAALLVLCLRFGLKVSRLQGAGFLTLYVAYVAYMFLKG